MRPRTVEDLPSGSHTGRVISQHDDEVALSDERFRLESLNFEDLVDRPEEVANLLQAAPFAGSGQIGGPWRRPLDLRVEQGEESLQIAPSEKFVTTFDELYVLIAHGAPPRMRKAPSYTYRAFSSMVE
jgi:hypothetical protein